MMLFTTTPFLTSCPSGRKAALPVSEVEKSGSGPERLDFSGKGRSLPAAISFCLSLLFLFAGPAAYGQFTGLVSSAESRCIADGTIRIDGASVTSIYAVTGPGYPQTTLGPGSESYIFETLPPGNFVVTEFKADNTEHTFPVSVAGNYQQNWQFVAEVLFGDCSDGGVGTITIGNFTITNATISQQRPPYEFRISEPGGVLPANGQGLPAYESVTEFIFPPTVAGSSFQLQARDSCGNFKTYNIQVPANSPQPDFSFTRLGYDNCEGDAEYRFNATGGTAPYLFEIISSSQPGDPLVGETSSDNPAFWILKGNTSYSVRIRDECGAVRTRTINVPAYSAPCISATGSPGICGGQGEEGSGALTVSTCQDGIGPYTLTVVGAGCGYSETFNDVPASFTINNLPRPCNFVITVTDGCMEQRVINIGLDGPSDASLGCSYTFLCPVAGSDLIRLETNVNNGPPYNPSYPVVIDLTDSDGISLPGYPKNMTENSGRRNTQSLEPGSYTYTMTDACGISCSQTVDIPVYESPVAVVDSEQQCYGSGQMIIVGTNGNPLNNSSDIYTIVSGPNFIGKTSEPDAPPGTGMFSNLISDGIYTFRYYDGCREFLLEEQVPTWTQPTYEVGYGLICGDNNSANLNMINLQPEGEIAMPYHWILQSTTSNQYTGPLPFPNSTGQTDSVFMDLVPNMNGSTATYFFLGYDNCKNSYQASGSVGFFPENELILSSYEVCPGPGATVTARVAVPIVGGVYEIFRNGELLVTTTNLFTTIQPALPGMYTARITVLDNDGEECIYVTEPVEITAIGELIVTDPDEKCPPEGADLTDPVITAGSSPGELSYWMDEALTQPVPHPDFVVSAGIYYIHLITDGPVSCSLTEPVEVVSVSCCPEIFIQSSVVVDANCNEENASIEVTATGSEFGYIFRWENEAGEIVSVTNRVSNVGPGVYTVYVSADLDGCDTETVYSVAVGTLEGPVIEIEELNNEDCGDGSGNVAISISGGTMPYQIIWSNGNDTPVNDNLSEGRYSVTVTDAEGCAEVGYVEVGNSAGGFEISVSVAESECGASSGSASAEAFGASLPVDYLWSNGETTAMIENLSAGTYSVTATDGEGCIAVENVIVTNSEDSGALPIEVVILENVACVGEADGEVQFLPAENMNYRVFNKEGLLIAAGANVTGLVAGEYTVVATDETGCQTVASFTIEEPAAVFDLIITGLGESQCENAGTGYIIIEATGGTAPYTYNWSGPDGFVSDEMNVWDVFHGAYSVTVTDENGCILHAEIEVEVFDTENPDVTLCDVEENVVMECAGENNLLIVESWHSNNVSELAQCITDDSNFEIRSDYDFVMEALVDGCSDFTGIYTVTYWAEDDCGFLSEEIVLSLLLEDTAAPDLSLCDLEALSAVVECTGDPEAQIAGWVAAGISALTACVTDVCSEFEVTSNVDEVLFEAGCSATTGEITVTFTVADECGNEISTDATLVIEDTTAPDLSLCDLEALSAVVECTGDPEAQIAGWVAAGISALTACATDVCSEFEVTSNVDEVLFEAGCSATTGEIIVTFTVTDECGNEISTDATLVIEDTTAPDITGCPATDMTIECESDENETNADNWNAANIQSLLACATDACSAAYTVISDYDWENFVPGCGDAGSIVVTYQVVDECGNISSDFIATLIIEDTTPPEVEILDALFNGAYNGVIDVECNSNLEDWVYPTLTLEEIVASDNCGSVAVTVENEFEIADDCTVSGYMMLHQYVITATDQCGNVTTVGSALRIIDTTAPDIFGVPADITVDCADIPECPSTGACGDSGPELVTSSDNCECGTLEYEELVTDQTCEYNYTLVRRWTATDKCGNVTVKEQRITVKDETAPELIPADPSIRGIEDGEEIRIDCEAWGLPEWVTDLDQRSVLAVDKCIGEIEVVFTKTVENGFQCVTDGFYDRLTYTWTAEDACGNSSSFGFVILLTDNSAPQITGPDNICDLDPANSGLEVVESCSAVVYWGFEDKIIKDDCLGEGVLRTWLAVDACNNMSVFDQYIFEEKPAPVVEIKSGMLPEGAESGSFILLNCEDTYMVDEFRKAEVSVAGGCENNSEVVFTEEVTDMPGCENGVASVITMRWTATDRCGQAGVYELFIHLKDEKAPSFFGNAREIFLECGEEIKWPAVNDNCSVQDLVLVSQDTLPAVLCANDLLLIQTFLASDACGNTSEFKRKVNIYDTEAPVFLSAEEVVCSSELNEPVVSEGCGEGKVELSFEDSITNETCGGVVVMKRIWTARDACGNTSVFEQAVITGDSFGEMEIINPFLGKLSGNETYRVECSALPADIVQAFRPSDIILAPECGFVSTDVRVRLEEEGSCEKEGYLYNFKIIYTVESPCSGRKEFNINVQLTDTTPPVFEYSPEDVEIYCGNEDALDEPVISDDCTEVSVDYKEQRIEQQGGDIQSGNYRLIRTWKATDACGNTSTHMQRVRFYTYELEAEIILVNPPQCNSINNRATVAVYNGTGPFKYEWSVVSGECEIIGSRFLQTIQYRIGFTPVILQVKITDSFGCETIKTIKFICSNIEVRGTEGGMDGDHMSMALFPNPAKDRLNLTWKGNETADIEFRIYSTVGELHLLKRSIQHKGANSYEFDLYELAPGIYFLEIKAGFSVTKRQFIVIK